MGQLIRLMRPGRWSKNLLCLTGLVFSGDLTDPNQVLRALGALVAFCAASSTVYILNDFLDRDRDRLHPRKKDRPLASGRVSSGAALALAGGLALVAGLGANLLGVGADACIAVYLLLGVAYCAGLKRVVLVDVLVMAVGFVLRLLSGVYALGLRPFAWGVLCTFFLGLVFGFGRRRMELGADADGRGPARGAYRRAQLDHLLHGAITSTVLGYALFTVSPAKNPTLVLTVPLVWLAVSRYGGRALDPERADPDLVFWRDRALVATAAAWLALYTAIDLTGFSILR